MKIKDLIKHLQKFDPELEIFVYERNSEKFRELVSIEEGIKVDDITGTKEDIENFAEIIKKELTSGNFQGVKLDKIIKEYPGIEFSNSQDVVILNAFWVLRRLTC